MPQLTLNNHKLYYAESRDALSERLPLLLIHGAGGQYSHWPPHLRRLPNSTVYTPDLPGHGKSAGQGRRTVAAYADDMLGFMDALNLRRVLLGGQSMGGAIALTMALNYPDRVAGLLLLSSGARLPVPKNISDNLLSNFERAVDLIIELAYGPNTSKQELRLGRRLLLKVDPQILQGDYAACQLFDVTAHLQEIRVPTLVVAGTADRFTPPEYAHYLAEHIPAAQLTLLADRGHMLAVEAPEEIAVIVDDWMSKLGKTK